MSIRNCYLKMLCVWVVVFGVSGSGYGLHFVATWDGGGDGTTYCIGENWDIDMVPCNEFPLTFDAIIGNSKTVSFDACGCGLGNECEVNKFTLGSGSTFKLTYQAAWMVDFQGVNGPDETQVNPAETKEGRQCLPDIACTYWNAFELPGIGLPGAVNPTMELKDSYGTETPVSFSFTGTVGGYNTDWGDPLLQDFIVMGFEDTDAVLSWEITNLIPGGWYSIIPLAGSGQGFTITVDTNGDGSLDDESAQGIADTCFKINPIYADESGRIVGRATVASGKPYGHWAGLQLYQANAECSLWPVKYSVLNDALISGRIEADNAVFEALGPGARLAGNKATLYARSGGEIKIAAPSYSPTGLWKSTRYDGTQTRYWDLIKSIGNCSVIDLSSVKSFNSGFDDTEDHNIHRVTVSSGGTIDLSGLETINAPHDDYDHLDFIVEDGISNIMLSSLRDTTSAAKGYTRFYMPNHGQLELPAISKLHNTIFDIRGKSSLIAVPSNGVNASYSSTGLWYSTRFDGTQTRNWYLMQSRGSGTSLNLSALTSINAGFNDSEDHNIHHIRALEGGAIDLSNVQTIRGPNDDYDYLNIYVDAAGSSINLSSLKDVRSASKGYTRFDIRNKANLALPSLQVIRDAVFYTYGGGNIVADSNDTSTSYASTNLWYSTRFDGTQKRNWYLMESNDPGSSINFSALTSINAGFNDSEDTNIHHIRALKGGEVDLSGVELIIGPHDDYDYLNILVNGADSSIRLSSLKEIKSAYRGYTQIVAQNKAELSLPSLQTLKETVFSVSGGSTINAGNQNSQTTTYSSRNLWYSTRFDGTQTRSWNLFLVSGDNSIADFPTLRTFDAGFNDSEDINVHKLNISSGTLNFCGLTRIITPHDSDDYLEFNISSGATADLSSLDTITSTGSGRVHFNVSGNSELNLFSLGNISAGCTVNVGDGCSVPLGALNISATTTFNIGAGSTLTMRGVKASKSAAIKLNHATSKLVFSESVRLDHPVAFTITDAADLHFWGDLSYIYDGAEEEKKFDVGKAFVYMDGTSLQGLEVGGIDVYTLEGRLTNNNFGMGQLTVGGCEHPSVVQLVDEVNNGNGQQNPEAMYLFGPDGRGAGGPLWADGLVLRSGSTLMLGDIGTYCQIGGEIVPLNEDGFFGAGNDVVTFGGGFIRRGAVSVDMAENLAVNGGFETGIMPPDVNDLYVTLPADSTDIEGWGVNTDSVDWAREGYFTDAGGEGALSVALNGEAGIGQTIATVPGYHYLVLFDMGANPYAAVDPNAEPVAKVTVAAVGKTQVFCFDAREGYGLAAEPANADEAWSVNWKRQAFVFVAEAEETVVEFYADNADGMQYVPAIDNVIVLENGVPEDERMHCWCYSCFEKGDTNGDCGITFTDVNAIIRAWSPEPYAANADVNKDGNVTFSDVNVIIAHWPPNDGCEEACVPIEF